MTPAFFPFTTITDSQRDALSSCFKQIIVYQASSRAAHESIKQMSRQGSIEMRVPVKQGDDMIEGALKEHLSLGRLHTQGALSYLKTQKNPPSFFDADSTAAIRTNILAGTKPSDPKEIKDKANENRLFKARLFLCMAQSFDRHHEEMNRELERFAEKEIHFPGMDSNHKREANIGVADTLRLENDYADYMATERLNAWAGLLQQDDHPPGLFVTTSKTLLSYMLEQAPMMEKVMERAFAPLAPDDEDIQDIEETLDRLSETDWPEHSGQKNNRQKNNDPEKNKPEKNRIAAPGAIARPTKKTGRLTLTFYIAPNRSPRQFFSRFSDVPALIRGEDDPKKQTGRPIKNTLIGLMELSPDV